LLCVCVPAQPTARTRSANAHQPEDLELSWRELRKPRPAFHNLAALLAFLGRARQRLRHGREQLIVSKRFWQEINRPAFHRTDTRWYIAVPGDKYYLLPSAFLRELLLEGEAVESRQLHVKHEARWAGVRHARKILGGANEDLDGVVLCRQQIGEARPDRLIVIHHEDVRF